MRYSLPERRAADPFPVVIWNEKTQATFVTPAQSPGDLPPASAALVFAIQSENFVVADIAGRGWCIPGGRLETGESPEEAARREAREEIGATLGPLEFLGCYILTNLADGTQTSAPTFRAEALRLEPLPPGSESRGVCMMRYEELPEHYFLWDELIAAVFALAQNPAKQSVVRER